jgi:hypothetical protein
MFSDFCRMRTTVTLSAIDNDVRSAKTSRAGRETGNVDSTSLQGVHLMKENLDIGTLGVASEMTRDGTGSTSLDFAWLFWD